MRKSHFNSCHVTKASEDMTN